MFNLLMIAGIFALLGVSLVPAAGELISINVPVKLIDGDVIEGTYNIVDDLRPYCGHVTNKTIGCADVSEADMFILKSAMGYVDPVYPIDIFTHEYLHIRCEYKQPASNWHYGNGDEQKIYPHIDYWNTCGR